MSLEITEKIKDKLSQMSDEMFRDLINLCKDEMSKRNYDGYSDQKSENCFNSVELIDA